MRITQLRLAAAVGLSSTLVAVGRWEADTPRAGGGWRVPVRESMLMPPVRKCIGPVASAQCPTAREPSPCSLGSGHST